MCAVPGEVSPGERGATVIRETPMPHAGTRGTALQARQGCLLPFRAQSNTLQDVVSFVINI